MPEHPAELPAGLHEPLHILEPGIHWLTVLLALLAVFLLIWLLRRWLRKPAEETPPPVPRNELPPVPATPFEAFLAELRERYDGASEYRTALHELAAGLRAHCEGLPRGRGFSTLTAREIAERAGSTALANVFEVVADLQFGRAAPSRGDFYAACELSREAIRKPSYKHLAPK